MMMNTEESRDQVKCLLAITGRQWGVQQTSAAAIYPWPTSRELTRSRVTRYPSESDGRRTLPVTLAGFQRLA
jgi:hypothetical protein